MIHKITVQTLFALAFALLVSFECLAQNLEVAKLDSAEGEVTVQVGNASPALASVGTVFHDQDIIRTGKYGRAGLLFSDGFLLRLAENTTLQLRPRDSNGAQQVNVESGKGYFFSREPKDFPVIASPSVTTAVRGTEFVIAVDANQTIVTLLDGKVECHNDKGRIGLIAGEQAVAKKGLAPIKNILVQPKDAVQWALSYPVLGNDLAYQASKESLIGRMSESVALGNSGEALQLFEADKSEKSAQALLYAANVYLSVGQVGQATELLSRAENAIAKQPLEQQAKLKSSLFSQKAVIAVTSNDKEKALQLASQAQDSNPSSPSAALTQAYVSQSSFRLDEARKGFLRVTEIEPENAFAWAKLAELEMGFGDFDKAQEYIEIAESKAPNNAFVLAVRGFVNLVRDETDEAKAAFDKAVSVDASLPIARLGRGLAIIRKGDLEAGREEIKRAVYLDPQVAIYRSYLGKTYFEEENEKAADHEYARAIELDPLDPTPYLYRAYSELSQNRPVQALDSVEKSIELNDSRAVYRSSLLLDQDVAVRSASLSEVFNSLGFYQVARIEAIKSLNQDYTNYSAHRLLGDSYNSILTNDARVSENKISRLLSPLSFNMFFERTSAQASLNEYSSLIDRSQDRTEIAALYDTQNDLVAPRIGYAGKTDKFGYFFGVDNTYAGGSKHNTYLAQNEARAAFQYQPTYDNRFVLESSTLYRNNNDANADYSETKFEGYDADLGYVHRFGPASKLITQYSYSNMHNNFYKDIDERLATIDVFNADDELTGDLNVLLREFARERVKSHRGTVQYLFDSDLASLVVGSQIYFADQDRTEDSPVLDDEQGIFTDFDLSLMSDSLNNLDAQDVYSYSTIHMNEWIDLTLGMTLSAVELDNREITPFIDGTQTRTRLNPKVGFTLYPTSSTTVRAAYFEGLRKSSLEDTGSLEPTLVAGINQRFTDFPGDTSRNFGAGIDQKIAGSTYFGVEGIHRNINSYLNTGDSVITVDTVNETVSSDAIYGEAFENHGTQDIVSSYLYHVLGESWVAALDYQWSDFSRDQDDFDDFTQGLHKAGFTVRYFSPQRWFVYGGPVWREQNRGGYGSEDLDGNNDFWVVNAGVGYRIPKRHGSVVLQFNNILDQNIKYDQSQGVEEFVNSGFGAALVASVNF